ncbi:MAG TPA: hypothetical protein VFE47_16770 [Tepidisphaeraceae bacterium]|nr:hypothetical protein [Tepidisphaeraceae bacterium]
MPPLLLSRWLAKKLQGADVERHVSRGGKTASRWAAAGIAVLSGLLVTSIGVAGMLAVG